MVTISLLPAFLLVFVVAEFRRVVDDVEMFRRSGNVRRLANC